MKQAIISVFSVVNPRNGVITGQIGITGAGQQAVEIVRKSSPRHSIILLEGFEIDGNFVPLELHK